MTRVECPQPPALQEYNRYTLNGSSLLPPHRARDCTGGDNRVSIPRAGPQQPRPGGKTLTSPGMPSELEARHVASPVYRHAEELDLEGKSGL